MAAGHHVRVRVVPGPQARVAQLGDLMPRGGDAAVDDEEEGAGLYRPRREDASSEDLLGGRDRVGEVFPVV